MAKVHFWGISKRNLKKMLTEITDAIILEGNEVARNDDLVTPYDARNHYIIHGQLQAYDDSVAIIKRISDQYGVSNDEMGKKKGFFKRLFCKHAYVQIRFREEIDHFRNTRYSVRNYRCPKCGKEIWVDGRHDNIHSVQTEGEK